MPVRLRLTFYGEAQVDRTLANMDARATDARPAWEVLAQRFWSAERRQFATEGAYGGGKWAPLSANYARWKAANYPGQPILRRTDELYHSLTEPDAPGSVYVVEPQRLIVGSAVEYGRYHQEGAGVLPRRRPVELPETERVEWSKILQRFLVTGRV